MSMWLGHLDTVRRRASATSARCRRCRIGLQTNFQRNFVWNPVPGATGAQPAIESQPSPHPAYVDQNLVIDPSQIVYEVNQVNRFLPLPTFHKWTLSSATRR